MDDRSGRDAWVGILVGLLVLFAAVAAISGIVLGVEMSLTERLADTGENERVRDGSTLAASILIGFLTATLFGAAAAVLVLLRDIARTLERGFPPREEPVPPQPSQATPWEASV